MKTWEISQYALFQKRKMTIHDLTEDHTSNVRAFSAFWPCLIYSSLTKNNPYFEVLYQKNTRIVKAAEEPEQNLTETHLLSTHASKASSHHSSAQDVRGAVRDWEGDLPHGSGRTTLIFSYSPKHCSRTESSLVRTHTRQGGDTTRLQNCEASCYVLLNRKERKRKKKKKRKYV